jgi:hypothetical protein
MARKENTVSAAPVTSSPASRFQAWVWTAFHSETA